MATILQAFCYYLNYAIVIMLIVVSAHTSSVHFGPVEGFKNLSDVIFPGEDTVLACAGIGMANCNISLYLNTTVIYENGQIKSGDYNITETGLSCYLRIRIDIVKIQHKGTYKCRVDSGGTTMEDSYELNVVTEWPHCLTKSVESGNSFQLFCYTSTPANHTPLFMKWEIIEPGSVPTTFINFQVYHVDRASISKIAGVSKENIKKTNLTSVFRCSHAKDLNQTCFINLTSPVIYVAPPTITSDIPKSESNLISSSRHTSPLSTQHQQNNEQSPMNTKHNVILIIVIVTVVLAILPVTLVIFIYKLKRPISIVCQTKKVRHTENKLAHTGFVFSDPSNQDSLESTYGDVSQNDTEIKDSSHGNNKGDSQLKNVLHNTIDESFDKLTGSQDNSETKQKASRETELNSQRDTERVRVHKPQDMYEQVAQRWHRYTGNQSPHNDIEVDSLEDQLNLQTTSRDNEEPGGSYELPEKKINGSLSSSQEYEQYPDNLYAKVKKRSGGINSYQCRPQDKEKYSYETNYNTPEMRRGSEPVEDLYKKVDKTANGTKASFIDPYETISIGDLKTEETDSDNNIEMVECVAYEPYQEETVEEEEDHYDVVDPSKEDNRDE